MLAYLCDFRAIATCAQLSPRNHRHLI